MTTRSRFLAAGAGALAVASASAARAQIFQLPPPLNAPQPFPTGPTMSIGVAGPFSGAQKDAGQQLVDGVQQALTDANLSQTLNEPSFILRTFDDQGSLSAAQLAAQFAINDQTVAAVVGHLGGKITDALVPTYGNAVCPLVVPASTYDDITAHGYRTVFRLPTKDSTEGQLFARYLDGAARPKQIVAFVADGDYGPDVGRGFMQQAAADKVPATAITVSVGKPDLQGATAAALNANPDFIFFAGLVKDLGPLIDTLRTAGYTGAFGASQGFFDDQTIVRYGKSIGGMLVSSSMPPLSLAPAAFTAKADFERQYGAMSPVSAFGYAAAQFVVTAARASGALNRITLARAMTAPTPVTTIVGQFTFGQNGDPLNPDVYLYTVRDGQWEYAHPAQPTAFLIK